MALNDKDFEKYKNESPEIKKWLIKNLLHDLKLNLIYNLIEDIEEIGDTDLLLKVYGIISEIESLIHLINSDKKNK